jgi:two-component system, LytTR family, response regulator
MYKLILIDDEPLARELIKAFLQPYNQQVTVVAECGDGFEGFKAIQQHQPDLIFLDVQMPRLTGFEMLDLIDNPPSVIFTTAFDEYALRAFEAHALDYLLKPIARERFDKAMAKWLQQAELKQKPQLTQLFQEKVNEAYQYRIVVKDNGLIRIIPAQDIHYIEADDDYVRIHTKAGSYMKKSTLNHIEQTLDPKQFVRVHRSFLVPVSQLQKIEPYEKESHVALLQCGAKITVSKTGMTRLRTLLGW